MKLTANFATCEKNSKLQAGFRCWILSRAIGGPAESRLAAAQVVLTPFSSPAFSLSHTLSLSLALSPHIFCLPALFLYCMVMIAKMTGYLQVCCFFF